MTVRGKIYTVRNGKLAEIDFDKMRERVKRRKAIRDYIKNATLEQLEWDKQLILFKDTLSLKDREMLLVIDRQLDKIKESF